MDFGTAGGWGGCILGWAGGWCLRSGTCFDYWKENVKDAVTTHMQNQLKLKHTKKNINIDKYF